MKDVEVEKPVIQIIKEKYGDIFFAEKKVAKFILENPEKAVNANVSELANYSGVSDATVVRFCKHIGFQGYYQLRISLSRDLGRDQTKEMNDSYQESDTVSDIFHAMSNNIRGIIDNIDQEELLECARVIKDARFVHIVAVGNTAPMAMDLGFRLGRLGIQTTYNMIAEYFLNHINLADEEDIVIAISQSGSSKHVVQALELAREKGLKEIAITRYKFSPVSRIADYLLLSKTSGKSTSYDSYSHLNEMAVVDALLHFVSNMESIEKKARNLDVPEMLLAEYKY